jgi:uncharacterized membrane protein
VNTLETERQPQSSRWRTILPRGVLLVVFLLALDYVLRYTPRYFVQDPAAYANKNAVHSVILVVHLCVGVAAILVGPLQLFTGSHRRSTRLHRWMGRAYVSAVFVGGVAAAAMLVLVDRLPNFRLGVAGLDVAWLTSTGFAYLAIRRGQVKLHQEWMVRSYVVTFGFVIYRIIRETLLATYNGPYPEIEALASWGCWSIPLLITQLVMEGRKVLAAPRRVVRTVAGA